MLRLQWTEKPEAPQTLVFEVELLGISQPSAQTAPRTTWALDELTDPEVERAIEIQQDGGVTAHRFEPSAARASPGMNDVAHSGCSAQWTTA